MINSLLLSTNFERIYGLDFVLYNKWYFVAIAPAQRYKSNHCLSRGSNFELAFEELSPHQTVRSIPVCREQNWYWWRIPRLSQPQARAQLLSICCAARAHSPQNPYVTNATCARRNHAGPLGHTHTATQSASNKANTFLFLYYGVLCSYVGHIHRPPRWCLVANNELKS